MSILPISSDKLDAIRLFITFLIVSSLGAHAYYRAKLLDETGSPKRWAFRLYSLAFALASALNLVSFLITVVTRAYGPIPWVRVGRFSIVLIIIYIAISMTTRREVKKKHVFQ